MDPYHFRDLCGRFATGVTVVTCFADDGTPVGMTVNSFASVSLEPPLVSIAIDHQASVFAALERAPRWTVNILEAGQEALSRRFSEFAAGRFDGVGWHRSDSGDLLLDGTLAQLTCLRREAFSVGDHSIVIGEVIAGVSAHHGAPLLFYRGGYGPPIGG